MARGDDEPNKIIPTQAEPHEEVLPAGEDDSGVEEAKSLSRGLDRRDLAKESEENEHDRGQAFKNHFEALSIIMLDVLFFGFILLATIWVLHMVLPEGSKGTGWVSYIHGWLTEAQLDKITGLLAGGVIAGLVADHFKRRMGS